MYDVCVIISGSKSVKLRVKDIETSLLDGKVYL